jgi:hypothetical protein
VERVLLPTIPTVGRTDGTPGDMEDILQSTSSQRLLQGPPGQDAGLSVLGG